VGYSQMNEVCEYNCYCIPPKLSFFVPILGLCNSGRVHERHSIASSGSAAILELRLT